MPSAQNSVFIADMLSKSIFLKDFNEAFLMTIEQPQFLLMSKVNPYGTVLKIPAGELSLYNVC